MAGLRAYLWPLAWALLFHAVALGLFSANWSSPSALRHSSNADPMRAELLTLVAPAPKPAPKPKAKPRPAPKAKAKPKAQKKAAPAPLAEAPAPARPEKAAPERNAPPAAPEPEKPSLQEVLGTDFEDALAAEATSDARDRPEALGSYEADLMARIVSQWSRPPSARNGMSCDLRLALVPTGELVSVTLVRSSGNAAFDRSAELAVRRAAPFQVPEDPAVFDAYFRSVTVTFSPNDLRY
jgi:colicin import membrane protein